MFGVIRRLWVADRFRGELTRPDRRYAISGPARECAAEVSYGSEIRLSAPIVSVRAAGGRAGFASARRGRIGSSGKGRCEPYQHK
jgi:hypothetical protein